MVKSSLTFLRTLLWIIAGILLVLFAVNNRVPVSVSLAPLYHTINVPLWSVLFAGIFIGLFITALVTSVLRLQGFVRRRQAERKADTLDKQVTALAEDAHETRSARAHDTASDKAVLVKDAK